MTSTITVGGEQVPCASPVTSWHEHGLTFAGLRPRKDTHAVCHHWTAGRGLGKQVHRTLLNRGLSVHFLIEPSGQIVQYVDADMRCSHAGTANAWSVGIEIVNAAGGIPSSGQILLKETIHGREFVYTSFTAAQVRAALDLTESLCRAYKLPMAVPMDGRDVLATVMQPSALKAFRGVIGHFHANGGKRDPGLALLRAVAAHKLRGVNGAAE